MRASWTGALLAVTTLSLGCMAEYYEHPPTHVHVVGLVGAFPASDTEFVKGGVLFAPDFTSFSDTWRSPRSFVSFYSEREGTVHVVAATLIGARAGDSAYVSINRAIRLEKSPATAVYYSAYVQVFDSSNTDVARLSRGEALTLKLIVRLPPSDSTHVLNFQLRKRSYWGGIPWPT